MIKDNDEKGLDGFQLHRAAVAYASVSDGPSPPPGGEHTGLRHTLPWPNGKEALRIKV